MPFVKNGLIQLNVPAAFFVQGKKIGQSSTGSPLGTDEIRRELVVESYGIFPPHDPGEIVSRQLLEAATQRVRARPRLETDTRSPERCLVIPGKGTKNRPASMSQPSAQRAVGVGVVGDYLEKRGRGGLC